MSNLRNEIQLELDLINNLLVELDQVTDLKALSSLEIAGVAAILQNFYNACENILKRILLSKKINLPNGANWHKDLIDIAVTNNILTTKTSEDLFSYLVFRHFFNHSYTLSLDVDKIGTLIIKIQNTFNEFQSDIKQHIK